MKKRRHYPGCRDVIKRVAEVDADWILDEIHVDSPNLQAHFRRYADGHGEWVDGDPPRPVGIFRRRLDDTPIMFYTDGGRLLPVLNAPQEDCN